MLDLAAQAEKAGDRELAEKLLRAVTADLDPQVQTEAKFRLGQLLAREGRRQEAAVLYRQILDEHPDAGPVRIELAQLLAMMGQDDKARRELRELRAGALPPEVARLVDRYSAALRESRPSGGSIDLALTADSNINRATRSDTLGTVIGDFTLSGDARAKAGYGVSLDGQAFTRFPLGDQLLLVTATGDGSFYQASRFNDVTLGVRAGPELAFGRTRLTLSLGHSRRWFGQSHFIDAWTAQGDLLQPLRPRLQLRASAGANGINNHRDALESGWSYAGGVQLEAALSRTSGVGGSLNLSRQALADPGYSTWAGNLSAFGWAELGRATISAQVSVGHLVADRRLLLYPVARNEWSSRVSAGATWRAVHWLGFSPTVRVTHERNRSPIELYDFRRTAVDVGIMRTF